MIDNFEQIKELLEFDSEDEFYHAVVLQRKKENPEVGSNSHLVKTYYIKSKEDLDFYREEMLALAKLHTARVCINLNRRSFEKMAFQTLRKITDIIMNKDFKSVRKAYNSVCGTYSSEKDKKWIIDIDDLNFNALRFKQLIYDIAPVGNKYIATIPTKNGYHLITKPFNIQEVNKHNYEFPPYDIHKDNPTILFIP